MHVMPRNNSASMINLSVSPDVDGASYGGGGLRSGLQSANQSQLSLVSPGSGKGKNQINRSGAATIEEISLVDDGVTPPLPPAEVDVEDRTASEMNSASGNNSFSFEDQVRDRD